MSDKRPRSPDQVDGGGPSKKRALLPLPFEAGDLGEFHTPLEYVQEPTPKPDGTIGLAEKWKVNQYVMRKGDRRAVARKYFSRQTTKTGRTKFTLLPRVDKASLPDLLVGACRANAFLDVGFILMALDGAVQPSEEQLRTCVRYAMESCSFEIMHLLIDNDRTPPGDVFNPLTSFKSFARITTIPIVSEEMLIAEMVDGQPVPILYKALMRLECANAIPILARAVKLNDALSSSQSVARYLNMLKAATNGDHVSNFKKLHEIVSPEGETDLNVDQYREVFEVAAGNQAVRIMVFMINQFRGDVEAYVEILRRTPLTDDQRADLQEVVGEPSIASLE